MTELSPCRHLSQFLPLPLLLSILGLFLHANAQDTAAATKTYIVHMDHSNLHLSHHTPNPSPKWYYRNVLSRLPGIEAAALKEQHIIYAYTQTVTGFAARLTHAQLQALRSLNNFVAAFPDKLHALHTTYTPHFMGLAGKQGAWAAHGVASDIVIGLLDTGVWPEHPSFSNPKHLPVPPAWKGVCQSGQDFNSSDCNGKLIGARYFHNGYESSIGPINPKFEYKSPRDNIGHGTHTASTAAGTPVAAASIFGYSSGVAAGMAPGARVAAYKICWSYGCATSDIIAGMDAAVADGVNVLSISLGAPASSAPFYTDSIAVAAFGAVSRGIFVACSAGNEGPDPATVSNGAPWVTTVAASSVDRTFPARLRLGNGSVFTGASIFGGAPVPRLKNLPMANGLLCFDDDLAHVRGKIVTCLMGGSRVAKGVAVRKAGGAAMVMLNNDQNGEGIIVDAHVLPTVSLGKRASDIVYPYADAGNGTATIELGKTTYNADEAPAVAAFSSRGPNQPSREILKPDVTAPGIIILAAWPANLSPTAEDEDLRRVAFNVESGTSMSCPHVAGVAALLRSARPEWSPAAVKSALMTTAVVVDNRRRGIRELWTGAADTPFGFGAGHVVPARAFDPGLVYDADENDYVEYLCALNYTAGEIGMFTKKSVTCPKNVRKASDLNYPSMAAVVSGSTVFRRKVTNVGVARSSYVAKVAATKGMQVRVEPQRLVFTKKGQMHVFRVSISFAGKAATEGGDFFGSLTWVPAGRGEHSVRSPIAVTLIPPYRAETSDSDDHVPSFTSK